AKASAAALFVNGSRVPVRPAADGYVALDGVKAGDVVDLSLPMAVRRIRAHEKVAADRGRLAVERGPILYCAEGADNAGGLLDARLPADATFAVEEFAIGDRKFPALRASNGLLLVPYCLWGNRKSGNEMQTWFLEK
ncbi:MAG: glycoside hydrolase family 127 protein, partial [Kiritimatiellae bacterium]|nr:glycoside hydrolase family 127 protein [Kiritimatiellia bacterium]